VLREADLIETREEGRQRVNSLNVVPIRRYTSAGSAALRSFGRAICCVSKKAAKPKRN
jgi:hypothetical protein